MKAGPTGRERIVYGLYRINARDVTSCRDKFAKAQDSAPVLPLDGAGAGYMKAVDGLHQVVEEMYPYYDRENYKDDKFAKGKELHSKFVSQVALFKTASKHFSEALFPLAVALHPKAARRQRWAVTPSPWRSKMRRQPR
jgi:hypothetical protein